MTAAMRQLVLVAIVVAAAACQERRVDPPLPGTSSATAASGGPAVAEPTAPGTGPAAPGTAPAAGAPTAGSSGDGALCGPAVRHVSALMGETTGIDEEIERCRAEAWPPEFLTCMITIRDVGAYASRCAKLLFSDADGLRVGRVFEPGASRAGNPPAGEQDGDLVLWDADDRCGFLTRKRYPGEAVYLVCGSTVFAGPLTTVQEIGTEVR